LDQLCLVPFSCDGVLDASQLAARVRRRRFTSAAFFHDRHNDLKIEVV
jgi:hypothetical protein